MTDKRKALDDTLLAPGPVAPSEEYAAWLSQRDHGKAREYWRAYLHGVVAPTPLVVNGMPNPQPGRGMRMRERVLSEGASDRLNALAKRVPCTMNTIVQAVWACLLRWYSGEATVVFGSTVSGRPEDLPSVERMMGPFIHTLPVRVHVNDAMTIGALLESLHAENAARIEHGYLALSDISRQTGVPAGTPLFDSLLAFENYPLSPESLELTNGGGELKIESGHTAEDTNYTFSVGATYQRVLGLILRYPAETVADETADRVLAHLSGMLEAIADRGAEITIDELLRPTGPERAMLSRFGGELAPVQRPRETLLQLFEAQVESRPDAVAVVSSGRRLSYSELDRRAARLAAALADRGVVPGDFVGVCVERSVETVVALLGVLKARTVYVPLDGDHPRARIAYMLEESGARLVITQSSLLDRLPGDGAVATLCIDELPAPAAPADAGHRRRTARREADIDAPAYVIFTSGSTGKPKGVLVPHAAIAATLASCRAVFEFGPGDSLPCLASTSFDISLVEMLLPLTSGGCTHVVPSFAVLHLDELIETTRAVTFLHAVPSLMQQWVAEVSRRGEPMAQLRGLLVGGDSVPRRLLQQIRAQLPHVALFELYGPTEAAVLSSCYSVDDPASGPEHCIGRPLPHASLRVLDARGQVCPIGVVGELYIGGAGLAQGYLNRPELTAEKFVAGPPSGDPEARLYRTGDLTRWLPDGTLEFVGRIDAQVKVRGYRIELGEIEAALAAYPTIREAVVIAREDTPGDRRLVAYLVASPAPPLEELRSQLGTQLPEYMIPSAFVVLDAMPLSANGKVDRKALPVPALAARTQPVIAPRDRTEELVARIWREVLGIEQLGVDDNFFALGGHSLLAMQIVSRIRDATHVDVSARAFFDAPTIEALAQVIAAGDPMLAEVIPAVPRDAPVRLSSTQEPLWFAHALDPASVAYNIPFALRLHGPLDALALASSLDEIVRRHEVLRTTLSGTGAAPVVRVSTPAPCTLRPEPVDTERDLEAIATAEVRRGFDFERGPLIRARLLQRGTDDHLLVITLHHIVGDGWSCDVLQHELLELYEGAVSKQPRPQPALAIQYADFASWERARAEGNALASSLAYWRDHVAGAPVVLELPTDRTRPPVQTFVGARQAFALPASSLDAIAKLCRAEGVTQFMTLFAAFGVLLHRYTGQDKLLVGVPVANRDRTETERLIGMFVNTLAFAADLSGEPTFREVLQRVRAATLGGFAHRELPFTRLVEELQPARDPSRSPVVQVMFAYQSAAVAPRTRVGDLSVARQPLETGTSKFELMLELQPQGSELAGWVEYNTALFDAGTIERFVQHFVGLVDALVTDPAARVSEVSLLTPAERQQLLVTWNDTAREVPDRRLDELFEAQVARTPDAVAVTFDGDHLTYRALDAQANQLAHRLRALGVGTDVLVPIHVERSLEMMVGILGILKAGGAYVPLDPAYPAERLAFMVRDCAPPVVLTQTRLRDQLPDDAHVVCLDQPVTGPHDKLPRTGNADSLAYGIYTSGSTGTPKCVLVTHRSVVNLLAHETYHLDASDRVLQKTPLTFDASVPELFGPLLAGARVVIARPEGHKDVGYLIDVVRAEQITSITFVPSLLELFVDEPALADCQSLRRVLVGGEALSFDVQARFFARSHAELYNTYGPTETTVTSSFWPCQREPADRTVPIGRPVTNTRLYVLDARQQLVPIGVPGELYIGGLGLARGYLHRAELTTERFVPDPFAPGARLYRTGDLVRYRADGALEFLGRTDHQVKLRGFRIELGEIEAALRDHPGVREVVVSVREDTPGHKHLVAYLIAPAAGAPTSDELRTRLRAKLPDYMIPAAFVTLDAFPLMVNGKVDRKALPAPAWSVTTKRIAPRDPSEELIAGIWREVLGVEELGVTDDFFALGGHSLLAMQVVSRIRETVGAALSVRAFFDGPTIRELARAAAGGSQTPVEPIPAVSRREPARLSSMQEQLWFVQALDPSSVAYNIPFTLRLRGPLDAEALSYAFAELVRRHDILRTTIEAAGESAMQQVLPPAPIALRAEPVARLLEAETLAAAEACRAFDLAHAPLIRARLLRVAEDDHVLVINMHHLISDGWSCGVLQHELFACYESRVAGRPPPQEPAIQYADYASWERARRERGALADALAFWKAHLAGVPVVLELPTDRPRPPVQTFAGARHGFVIPKRSLDAVARLCRAEGVTTFMTLFSVFGVLLHRYTGQDRMIVGVPVANRSRTDTERVIGLFINTLAVSADLSGDPTFHELLQRIRGATLAGFAHQDLPFHKLVEELQPARDSSRGPLVQVMFAYQSQTLETESEAAGLSVTRLPVETGTSKFELTLELEPRGQELAGAVEYNTDLFDASTIARLVGHFVVLVEALVADPWVRVSEVSLLTPAERHQVLIAWNDTACPFPADQRLDQLFEAQVARTPDAVAVRFEDSQLTYRQLDVRANQLAHRLRELGVEPDVLVPICVERSLEMVVGILGILKAGGAYVPLDPEYPADRLAFMLEDSAPRVVLTQARLRDALPAGAWHLVALDAADPGDQPSDPRPRHGSPTDLAYGIYTSGSTGTPKCALVEHRGVVSLLTWMQDTYQLDGTDRVLQKTPLIFDASVRDLLWPLLVGARLVVARPEGHKDVGYLLDVIRTEQITTINFVPSLLDIFVEEPALAECVSLRRVIAGGEALSDDVRARFYARSTATLYNHYGPTETTVTSTYWPCPRDAQERIVPIGRPIANTRLYVLDARQQPVPIGIPGELYIAGVGVARGYLARPALTAERFVQDPFVDDAGARMYRTGDVVRYRADGVVEYLGRTDHQVKIRGFRIELGEIEAALRAHPAIREAVVTAREDTPGHKHLVAYLVGTPPAPDELRSLLRARLPEYMVPASFVTLDALPLMVNGKVDRKALPAPTVSRPTRALVSPRDPTEALIAGIWRELLGVEEVGVHDDFFELGGHSLLAMQVVSRIRRSLAVDIPLRLLFQAKTIEEQARQLTQRSTEPTPDFNSLIVRTDNPIARASVGQDQFYYLSKEDPDPTAYFISNNVFVLEGPLDPELLIRSYCELVGYHSIFRTTFREVDGLLYQVVPPEPAAPPCLEFEERLDVPEDRLGDEIKRNVDELMAVPYDLAAGIGVIRARLVALGPARHLLVILIHHIASDGAAFTKQLFDGYARLRDGSPTALPSELPLQYIDLAHALARWSETPQGQAQRAYWQERVHGAQPLEVPFDFPRAPVDARRDALPFGISPDLNYPPEYHPLPAPVRAVVIRAARALKTTPYMIYLGALAWLFHHRSGQDEISIQTTYSYRSEYPALEQVQGPLAWWTHVRIDTSARPTFAEVVRRTSLAVDGARANGIVQDYFQRVPHGLRRSAFNYLPLSAIPMEERVADLLVRRKRQPFPRWKRHWDLHLTLMDFANDTMLVWTGSQKLYRHETVVALLQRYVDILAHAAD